MSIELRFMKKTSKSAKPFTFHKNFKKNQKKFKKILKFLILRPLFGLTKEIIALCGYTDNQAEKAAK